MATYAKPQKMNECREKIKQIVLIFNGLLSIVICKIIVFKITIVSII